jgi:hypothetical protein
MVTIVPVHGSNANSLARLGETALKKALKQQRNGSGAKIAVDPVIKLFCVAKSRARSDARLGN